MFTFNPYIKFFIKLILCKGLGPYSFNASICFDEQENIWLGTDPNTRAEHFYRRSGWNEIGTHENGEIKFEMTQENWKKYSR